MTNTIDRSEINRSLAKAIAYKQCGQHATAELWAARLLGLLECADILDPNRIGLVEAANGDHVEQGSRTKTSFGTLKGAR